MPPMLLLRADVGILSKFYRGSRSSCGCRRREIRRQEHRGRLGGDRERCWRASGSENVNKHQRERARGQDATTRPPLPEGRLNSNVLNLMRWPTSSTRSFAFFRNNVDRLTPRRGDKGALT